MKLRTVLYAKTQKEIRRLTKKMDFYKSVYDAWRGILDTAIEKHLFDSYANHKAFVAFHTMRKIQCKIDKLNELIRILGY